MNYPSWWNQAEPKIHARLENFTKWMQQKITTLKPHTLIEKNPFLFRARDYENASQLANKLIDAFISSSEETKFGDILEDIAIDICGEAKSGWKSSAQGIDLEFETANTRTLTQIKSSNKWGNSSAHKRLVTDFVNATRIVRQHTKLQVVCVEGICYGPSQTKDRGTHLRIIGDEFWESISDWKDTGRAVFKIVGHHAGNGLSAELSWAYANIEDYLLRVRVASPRGRLNWNRLYELTMMNMSERPK